MVIRLPSQQLFLARTGQAFPASTIRCVQIHDRIAPSCRPFGFVVVAPENRRSFSPRSAIAKEEATDDRTPSGIAMVQDRQVASPTSLVLTDPAGKPRDLTLDNVCQPSRDQGTKPASVGTAEIGLMLG